MAYGTKNTLTIQAMATSTAVPLPASFARFSPCAFSTNRMKECEKVYQVFLIDLVHIRVRIAVSEKQYLL